MRRNQAQAIDCSTACNAVCHPSTHRHSDAHPPLNPRSFLHDKGYRAWEIDWKRAKIGQPVGAIDPAATQGRPVDISTHKVSGQAISTQQCSVGRAWWLNPGGGVRRAASTLTVALERPPLRGWLAPDPCAGPQGAHRRGEAALQH